MHKNERTNEMQVGPIFTLQDGNNGVPNRNSVTMSHFSPSVLQSQQTRGALANKCSS